MRNKAVFVSQIKLKGSRSSNGIHLFEDAEGVIRDTMRVYGWWNYELRPKIKKAIFKLRIGDTTSFKYSSGTIVISKMELQRARG